MKFEFRGVLNNGVIVDIFKFENNIAMCYNDKEYDIDEFNVIFYQKDKFKKEVLGIKEVKTSKKTKVTKEIKTSKKKEKAIG